LRNRFHRAPELFKKGRRDGQKVNSSKGLDLARLIYKLESEYNETTAGTHIAERRAHDDGLVTVLLIVIENLLDRLNTRILIAFIVLSGSFLVPVEDLF